MITKLRQKKVTLTLVDDCNLTPCRPRRRRWRHSSCCQSRCTPGLRWVEAGVLAGGEGAAPRCPLLTRSVCGWEPMSCWNTHWRMLRNYSRRTVSRSGIGSRRGDTSRREVGCGSRRDVGGGRRTGAGDASRREVGGGRTGAGDGKIKTGHRRCRILDSGRTELGTDSLGLGLSQGPDDHHGGIGAADDPTFAFYAHAHAHAPRSPWHASTTGTSRRGRTRRQWRQNRQLQLF